jgi:hypothetical protein
MSGSADEHAALVALLRGVAKGESWSSVAEDVLASGSALAAWEQRSADSLIPDPARVSLFDRALSDIAIWANAG